MLRKNYASELSLLVADQKICHTCLIFPSPKTCTTSFPIGNTIFPSKLYFPEMNTGDTANVMFSMPNFLLSQENVKFSKSNMSSPKTCTSFNAHSKLRNEIRLTPGKTTDQAPSVLVYLAKCCSSKSKRMLGTYTSSRNSLISSIIPSGSLPSPQQLEIRRPTMTAKTIFC